jgi:hypothetical protein
VEQLNNFDEKLYFKDPWHVQVFESEKVQELADLKRKELEASINLEKAIASQCAEQSPLLMKLNSITKSNSMNTH